MAVASPGRSSALRLRSLTFVLALFVLIGCTTGKAPPARRQRRRRRSQTQPEVPMQERMAAMEKQVHQLQAEVKKLNALVKEGGSGGAKPLPMPEVQACKGKKASDTCGFVGPDGSKKIGRCIAGNSLWCNPVILPRRPVVGACNGKKEKDACDYVAPDGSNRTGFCFLKKMLWCKPDWGNGAPKPVVQACIGKKAKDVCWYAPQGHRKIGSCVAPSGGARKLWCKISQGGANAPRHALKACIGKKDKAVCSFPSPAGPKRSGFCVSKVGEKILWCRAGPWSPFPMLMVKACAGKQKRDACSLTIPDGSTKKGSCIGGTKLWCKVTLGGQASEQAENPQEKPMNKLPRSEQAAQGEPRNKLPSSEQAAQGGRRGGNPQDRA